MPRILANGLLLVLWLWFFRPVYGYLGVIFTQQEFRTNQIVLVAVIALIVVQVRKGGLRPHPDALPQLYYPALALALAGSALFLVSERYLDVNTLSASMFVLASYGLLGLWLSPRRWRQGLPAALLLVGALPFGEHMQTFIGYPVRVVTAGLVGKGLAALGFSSIGLETILVFENGISQVDLPCSGVQSLWTGGLFLLAVTWIERRPFNLRWLGTALVFVLLLLGSNLARVGVLIFAGQVMAWRLLAEMIHVPLGVLGFVLSCAAAAWLLRRAPSPLDRAVEPQAFRPPMRRPAWLLPVLALAVALMILLYAPRPQPAAAQTPYGWQLPEAIQSEPWPLRPDELAWLSENGLESVARWRFRWQGQTGSILLVSSTTWRAHHRPERCFQVYGLTVNSSQSFLAAQDFALRLLTLGKDRQDDLVSAVYWLQSADRVTDDYASRMWSDLALERQRWVQITILYDEIGDPISSDSRELYHLLRRSVQHSLQGGKEE